MIPGMNPKQMQQAMKKLGMQQTEIDAVQVIIKTREKQLVFSQPQVAKVVMMGQETYQIIGNPVEKPLSTEPEISDDDIKTVMEQAGVDRKTAESAIKKTKGDLAEAILSLQNQ